MVSLMKSVVESGTARAAGLKLQRPAAGKTGTSNGAGDAWFRGVHARVAGLPCGSASDDGKSLGQRRGRGRTALPLWIDFMVKPWLDRPVRDFGSRREWPWCKSIRPPDFCLRLVPKPSARFFLDGTGAQGTGRPAASRRMRLQMLLREETSSHHNPATAVPVVVVKRGRGRGRLRIRFRSGPRFGPGSRKAASFSQASL